MAVKQTFISLFFFSVLLISAQSDDNDAEDGGSPSNDLLNIANDKDDMSPEVREVGPIYVNPPAGPMEGMEMEMGRKRYTAFLGIPYAQPPIGPLRFADALPLEPWDKVREMKEFGNRCPQVKNGNPGSRSEDATIIGSEDCLFLNVFTPNIPARPDVSPPKASLKPVMVYFHGGRFKRGSGNVDPKPLVNRDVLVVSVNYRLGVLGFLNLNNEYVSGNQGLKDQVLALMWVRDNIVSFGGNPDEVVIFGEDSGAVSVHLHLLSPLTEGLFRGAIAMSGNAIGREIERRRRQVNKVESERFLVHTECDLGGATEILDCLQSKTVANLCKDPRFKDADDIPVEVAETRSEAEAGKAGYGPFRFGPTIDDFSPAPFIPQEPYLTMRQGLQRKVPFIIGLTRDDGANVVRKVWDNLEEEINNWGDYGAPRLFDIPFTFTTPYDKLLSETILHFYLGSRQIEPTKENAKALTDMFTDVHHRSPTNKVLELLSQTMSEPIFSYELHHRPKKSHMEKFSQTISDDPNYSVVAEDQLLYIFDPTKGNGIKGSPGKKPNENKLDIDDDDRRTRNCMVETFTNFAKVLDPTPFYNPDMKPWDQYDIQNRLYLAIGPNPEMRAKSRNAPMYFHQRVYWEDLDAQFSEENEGRHSAVIPQSENPTTGIIDPVNSASGLSGAPPGIVIAESRSAPTAKIPSNNNVAMMKPISYSAFGFPGFPVSYPTQRQQQQQKEKKKSDLYKFKYFSRR